MQAKSCKLPTMPIGFRFRPSDRQIINVYLIKRMKGHDYSYVIRDIDLCRYEPWELPRVSVLEDEEMWHFFCRPEYKYSNSKRANRATGSGFWKPTGKVRSIRGRDGAEIGTKRTLVFYAKTGSGSVRDGRTTWVIHEYQVPNSEFVFCKLKDKSDEQTYSSAVEEAEQDIQFGFEAGCDTPSASITLADIARIHQELDASDSEFDPNGVSAMGRKAVDCQGMTGDVWLQFDQFLCQSREDEADQLFADSLLTEPEECVKHCNLPPRELRDKCVAQGGSSGMNDLHTSARQLSQAASVQIVCEKVVKHSGSPLSLDVNQSRVKIPKRFTLHRSRRVVKVLHVPEEPELLESSKSSAKCQKVSRTRQSDRQAFLESTKVSPTRLSIGQAKGGYLHLDAKKGFPVGKKTSIRNTKKYSFTRRNTPSHQPTPPTPFAHIVNVTVGLVLLVVVIVQMMPF